MLISLSRSGQTANQLLTLSAMYSLALEYNVDLKCPVMDENLKKYFKFNREDKIDVKMYHSKFWNLVFLFNKCIQKLFKLKVNEKLNKNKLHKNQFFHSWISFKEDDIYVKHLPEIREYFQFNDEITKKSESVMNSFKSELPLVAVHLRRADYKYFRNGIWYYDDNQFLKWMENINSQKKVKFIVFSNEKIDIDFYKASGLLVEKVNGSAYEDLCCMSMCDYIMGPPSTYSSWAALYGNKKKCEVKDKNKLYSFDDFYFYNQWEGK